MRKTKHIVLASAALALAAGHANAANITLQKNGFIPYANGTIAGEAVNADAVDYTTVASLADGTYYVDLYHNSGALGSDFGFTLTGGLISAVTTGNYGGNSFIIADPVTSIGTTTLQLVPHTVNYNSNLGQKGPYYSSGVIPYAQYGTTYTGPMLAGYVSLDNLYNSGGGNEDLAFVVQNNGSVLASPDSSGPITNPIPHSEYITPVAPNNVDVNAITAHYKIVASAPIAFVTDLPYTNYTSSGFTYEFDMLMAIGSAGVNIYSFGDNTAGVGNVILPDGTLQTGSFVTNDYHFNPLLRYDKTYANGYDYYLQNGTGGAVATGSTDGFYDDDTTPLSVTVTATLIPEPASMTLLGLGGLLILKRKRHIA